MLALAAAGTPLVASAQQATPEAPSTTAPSRLAEQPVVLSDRGVIWQATPLPVLSAGAPAWPFHTGFILALDAPLDVRASSGAVVSELPPGSAMPVAELARVVPTSIVANADYLAIELVGQDDSDSAFRRPFKADPGQYTLTLWSLTADAGSDAAIAALLAENLPGAPVLLAVRAGGVAIAPADGGSAAQLLQGSWDAIDADSTVTVPAAVTAELLVATIAARRGGGDDDLGAGGASATTTSNSSSIVDAPVPGITLLNYRTATLDAADLTWQVVTGETSPEPVETRYQRGFIVALNGPIALTEDDGSFRRVNFGNAVTVRNGDRFSAESLTTQDEPFIAVELLAASDASDPNAPAFAIPDGHYTFELWQATLEQENGDRLAEFMAATELPSLFLVQRGTVQVTPAGETDAQALGAGSAQVIAAGARFTLGDASTLILIARLRPL
jgi:hypothetical protein